MKILIASESFHPFFSGVSVSIQRIATELVKQGHSVAVVTPAYEGGYAEEMFQGCTVYRLPSRNNPFRKGHRLTRAFSYLFIPRVFREFQPDIVHIHEPSLLCRLVAQAAKRQAIPVVVTQHFVFETIMLYVPMLKHWHPLLTTIGKKALIQFYNTCDYLTVPTKTLQTYVAESAPKIPLQVISNGVDTREFNPDIKPLFSYGHLTIPTDKVIVGYVGRMDLEKNISIVLQAFAELPDTCHLLMVGGGTKLAELKQEAKALGIDGRVTWTGKVELEETFTRLFAALDVFCMPSPSETESMVTLEAMALGLPVVAAASGALPELVVDGENGFLVAPHDQSQWLAALKKVTSNTKLRTAMGKCSRERSLERSFEQTIHRFVALYTKLLA